MKLKETSKESTSEENIKKHPVFKEKEFEVKSENNPPRNGWSYFYGLIKGLLRFFEKMIKLVSIIILTLCASLFFLVGSLYFFSATFNLKDSPSFQVLRDRLGAIYAVEVEREINRAEKNKEWEWKSHLESLKKDMEAEEKLKQAALELQNMKVEEQRDTLESLTEKIQAAEAELQNKERELKEMEQKLKSTPTP